MNGNHMPNPPATAIARQPASQRTTRVAAAEPTGSAGARERRGGDVRTKKQQKPPPAPKKQPTVVERQSYVRKEPVPVPQYVPVPQLRASAKVCPREREERLQNVKIENKDFRTVNFSERGGRFVALVLL
ncbi:hypothetical protein DFJ73DRAFT_771622 [Zopfochytrium polystomum]|nr:hypothetical protein DFJ73DRAFT_771622 [Zopfochytrium polystomum]